MKIVIALGGSVLVPELDSARIKNYAEMVLRLQKEHDVKIVVGGGKEAKRYIEACRALGASEEECDVVGIIFTRINARLLMAAMGLAGNIPKTEEECLTKAVMGGTTPGHSTDAVAASLAEKFGADLLVIATDVDGVYDKDPKKFEDAKKLDKVSPEKIVEMTRMEKWTAGPRMVLDPLAAEIISDSKIRTVIINGSDTKEIENAVAGKHKGTTISS